MIAPGKDSCWIIGLNSEDAGLNDREPHFTSRTDAEEELGRLRGEDRDLYETVVVRQLDNPCWVARCDGDCGYAIDEADEGLNHYKTAADAEQAVRHREWRMLPDGAHVYCPEDAPEDGQVPPPTASEQERAGQLVLPGCRRDRAIRGRRAGSEII